MKTLITTIALSLIIYNTKAQDLPKNPDTGLYEYSEVIEAKQSKNQLFANARGWFSKTFKSSNDVIQYSDKEEGKVEGRFTIPVIVKPMGMTYEAGNVRVDVTVLVKDNKYKYIFTNFYHEYNGRKLSWKSIGTLEDYQPDGLQVRGPNKKQFGYIKEQINDSVVSIILELKKQMNVNSSDF